MRTFKMLAVVLMMVTCTAALAQSDAQQPAQSDAQAKTNQTQAYVIGAGDLLAINVWKETELTRTVLVRPDGRISLPLVGELQAGGRTAAQLQAEITDKLSSFISHPQVNVIVQEIKSRSFNVVGKVVKPGEFVLIRPTTVLDGVAQAGGFLEFAKTTKIYVLRRLSDGTTSMLPFNYKKVIKGQGLEQNVLLLPGDTIVVP
ncbi:MAG TPA: polysaccharide biosynthesis/export family protein [Terracidiphilus sp.]